MPDVDPDVPDDVLTRLGAEALRLHRMTTTPPQRIRVQQGDVVIEAEWPQAPVTAAAPVPVAAVATPVAPALVAVPAVPEPEAPEPDPGVVVTAPLLGTFYRSPQPGADPFVAPGDVVTAGQQVAIVEAMKLLNAITAEESGVVREVLVDDATPVEFGQALLVIDPLAA